MNGGNINRRELMFKALAGLAGGALGWLPVELVSHNASLDQPVTTVLAILSYISMGILSALVGGFIVAGEAQELKLTAQTKWRFWRGAGTCLALGILAQWLIANPIFNAILSSGGWGLRPDGSFGHGSFAYLMLGRVLSWVAMGAMLGVGVGTATLSPANVVKGAIGGFVGGFIGGVFFDPINAITGGGLLSRLIGLSAIGLAIGLFIGLVQELTKAAWVTVEQGRLKGRQYRIEGAHATLGRAEENPVGLFGDQAVQPRHAIIERRGPDYVLRNLAIQAGTFVNGNRIEAVDLHDGDRVGIGGYELIFHLRVSSAPARQQASLALDRPSDAHVASRLAGARVKVDGPCLIDESGQKYAVQKGVTRLGRALDNEIVISHSSVSRHHASIQAGNGSFELKDLNSQNGTFVANRRVTQAHISDGDAVRFGDAPFTFRA